MKRIQKHFISLLSLALSLFTVFTSCEEKDKAAFSVSRIGGLAEKGPFVANSSVIVCELDKNLNGTGRMFEATTDDEGAFAVDVSASLVSEYVKIVVSGFYFNEYAGVVSQQPVVLEALASISGKPDARINVNVLTHLETPRVANLVASGMDFQEAKKQASEEILKAFLITNQTLVPEETSLTDYNASADVLIAVSSILLNQKSDIEASEMMDELRDDMVDGSLSVDNGSLISASSYGLNYERIKENIQSKYSSLGKDVKIGAFERFIDGDGDGELGDDFLIIYDPQIVDPEEFFVKEENVWNFLNTITKQCYSFLQFQYLFDGVYTHTVASSEGLNASWRSVYHHLQTPSTDVFSDLWLKAYQAIHACNVLIEASQQYRYDWFEKYERAARVYRACLYMELVVIWGDVPLVLKMPDEEELAQIVRTPQDEVLDFIVNELELAESLPEAAVRPECSSYFARAIQARACLYKKDYAKALACVKAIIDSGKYYLSVDLDAIYAGENHEVIFELPNDDLSSLSYYRSLIRKGAFLPVCRYTEVLLMAAEANLKSGNGESVVGLLNQLKTRRGQEPVDLSSDLESVLLNAWKEEMKNEGLWFAALKRLGKAQEELEIEDYRLLLPIPLKELNNCPGLAQNPGY